MHLDKTTLRIQPNKKHLTADNVFLKPFTLLLTECSENTNYVFMVPIILFHKLVS